MHTHFIRSHLLRPRGFLKPRRTPNAKPARPGRPCSRRAQRGAAGIEFGLLFIIFFSIFYGLVGYALPMLMIQAFHHAAASGARAGVAVDNTQFPNDGAYNAAVEAQARQVVVTLLDWLPPAAKDAVLGASGEKVDVLIDNGIVSVTVDFPNYRANPLMPILVLPVIGEVPNLPNNLTAIASLNL